MNKNPYHTTKKQNDLLLKRIRKKIGTAIVKYNLIEENDRIVVGLSGGKDSYILLESLAYFRDKSPFKYELFAVHINIQNIPYESDYEYLKQFCDNINVPFYVRNRTFELKDEKEKSICFQCSWNRRKELFLFANQMKCTKMALGHHMDDIVETLLMNMFYQGTISSMPPKMAMDKWLHYIIRPLALVSENEIQQLFDLRGYEKQKKNCPFEKETARNTIKKLLIDFEKQLPNVRNNIFNSMGKIMKEYLP